jgi:hypothetical protein
MRHLGARPLLYATAAGQPSPMSDRDSTPPLHPRAKADVLFRRVGEDWLLFDPSTERIHVLNLAAALVWSHCSGEHDAEEIRTRMTDAYGQPVERQAVDEALARFHAEGLLAS